MARRIALVVLPLAALTLASTARAADSSVTIEGLIGWQSLRPSASGLGGAIGGREGTAIAGGDILARIEGFGIGASVDKTLSGSGGQPWAGSALVGFLIDPLPTLRLEALGEIGRRATVFGDIFNSKGNTFLGVRPGVSVRLMPSPVRVGVSVPIRWNTSGGSFSSPDYGFVGRIGVEFP